MTKIKTNSADRLRRLLVARLEGRAQPWACAVPIDLTVKRDSRDHQRLVSAAHELLRCIGARQPTGAHHEPAAKTGFALVRQWLRVGLEPETGPEAGTARARVLLYRPEASRQVTGRAQDEPSQVSPC